MVNFWSKQDTKKHDLNLIDSFLYGNRYATLY